MADSTGPADADVVPFPQPLVDAFRARPELPAFEYGGRPVPRGEVLEMTARCLGGLTAAGLGPGPGGGRSVAVATGVSPGAFAAQLAAHLLGCRVTGLRPGLTPGQLAHALGGDGAGVDAVITDDAAERPGLAAAAGDATVLRLEPDLLRAEPVADEELRARGRAEDVALVTLTSGSTGRPKGCARTYRSLTEHWTWQPARWTEPIARLAAGYRRYLCFGTLTSAPIFEHLGVCLLSGGTAVIPDPPLVFPQLFEQHRITACMMTVPRLHHVLDALRTEPVDTSSLRVVIVSGSPLAPHRLAEATRRLGPVVHCAFGQTESGMLTLLTPDDIAAGPPEVLGSVGRPWAGVEVSVRDEAERPVPPGTTGEIWVRTEAALSHYWGEPELSREVLREDGWVRTRDVGRLDGRGFVHLTGRARDIIIVNAIVHYAGAIERALAAHGDVDEAHVVGVPDERTGEAAHAFVVPAAGREPDVAALCAAVAAELGEASVPATVTVVPKVPLAPSGKPDKRALREEVLGRPGAAGVTPRRV
jgi:acyl-CoA synthetase (AMP-forming)/AMP-acid ligase II